ncbi:MAG: rod shape-determining protein [Candidatus Campbellbacteria bacterium]|nr:rod shape-determining protein [Candidatus Campbellbacteria bacterium]
MSPLSPKLGIDLGTANTLVFIKGRGIVLNEPSVVAIIEGESKVLAVGLEAKDMIGRTPETIVAHHPLKDGVIADYKITEAMLRYYIRKAVGSWNPFKPEIMVSVPAGVTSTERRAVIEAALKAGAGNVYIVKEPILAAIGAGIPIQEAGGHIIVDIGGGTTDVAVISLGGIVASTSIKCAGNRIDASIIKHIKREHNLSIGEKTAEEIKIKIGTAKHLSKELTMEVKGSDFETSLPRTVSVRSNAIAEAIETELSEIIKAIKDVLQETPPELAADIIDRGITMTGGSSLLRKLPELVHDRTGVKATLANDPLFCVAKGTGVALEHLNTYKKSIITKR